MSLGHHHEAAEGTVRLPAGRGQPVRSRHSGRCQRVSLAELNNIQKHAGTERLRSLNTRYSGVENLVHTQKKLFVLFN
jgi:hypothetical protein